jgi:glycosyltransferase involved in cell wall biosynthesis
MAERRLLKRVVRRRPTYDVVFYMPWIGPLLAPGAAAPTGGAETQIYLVAQALAARGLRVCIVSFQTPEGLPRRVHGIDIVPRRQHRAHARWTGKVTEALSIWRALAGLRSDVVVTRASGPHVGIVGVFAWIWRRRFVYSSANVVDFTLELENERRNRALYKLGVRLARTIVVQTEEQVALCKEAFDREPVLIKSLAESAAPGDRRPLALLWVGRAIFYKQPMKFLELARRVPQARFRMVAVPEPTFSLGLMEEVRREAATIPNVELLDPRPRDSVLSLMDEAVAIVNTADYEGLPNIFLEGWARGVPAIALSHDPDGLITQRGLGYFGAGSLERFAEQAAELWAKRDELGEMGDRCVRYVEENHAEEAVAEKWMSVIRGEDARPESPERPGELVTIGRSSMAASESDATEVA